MFEAHWVKGKKSVDKLYDKWYCSNCGARMFPTEIKPPYCWNCGKEMNYLDLDLEEDDG